jgi:GntR family transcriptional repressor for pyruvate dehydrogenase complex
VSIRRKLSQEVSDGILEMIQSGSISPGEQIPPEYELVSLFQVSRTAVREGIKSLVAIGVLETRRGIGTFLKDAKPGPLRYFSEASHKSFLKDLLEFRLIVEPETAALAAERRSHENLKELDRCVEVLEKFVLAERKGKPPEDLGFHLELARAARNSALVDASSMIARFYENDPFPPDSRDVQDHRAIYEFVRDRNSESARQRMRQHLSSQREKYLED